MLQSSLQTTPMWCERYGRKADRRFAFNAILLMALAVPGLGCSGDSFDLAPMLSEENLYWRLDLNHKAVLLSMAPPYDTLQLVATPRNHLNASIPGAPAPQYTSRDLTRVSVTPEGVLQAVGPTTPGTVVPVIARLSANGVTHVDTVFVSVVNTDPIPFLDSISIQPVSPDSAKVAVTQRGTVVDGHVPDTLVIRSFRTGGAPLLTIPAVTSGGVLPVRLSVADTTIAQLDKNLFSPNQRPGITGLRVGTTTIYARTTVFGVSFVDSLPYRIGWPLLIHNDLVYPASAGSNVGIMSSTNLFRKPVVRIGVGGIVTWRMIGTGLDPRINTELLFDPEDLPNIEAILPLPSNYWLPLRNIFACLAVFAGDCTESGNVTITAAKPIGGRIFRTPGTYEYRSSQFPESVGKVIVIDER